MILPKYIYLIINDYAFDERLDSVIPTIEWKECQYSVHLTCDYDWDRMKMFPRVHTVVIKGVILLPLPDNILFATYEVHPNTWYMITHLPPRLRSLTCRCWFRGISCPLPPTLRSLTIEDNGVLEVLPMFPEGLTSLSYRAGRNPLSALPKGLKILDLTAYLLTELPELPERLVKLILSSSCVNQLPVLPITLKELRVDKMNKRLHVLPYLHEGLEILFIDGTDVTLPTKLPSTLKQIRHITPVKVW